MQAIDLASIQTVQRPENTTENYCRISKPLLPQRTYIHIEHVGAGIAKPTDTLFFLDFV